MTILSELIDLNRFSSPRQLMAFVGLIPGEYSSGGKQWRGSITKSGNTHVRRVLVEAAWHYRHSPRCTGEAIRKRREGQPPEVIEKDHGAFAADAEARGRNGESSTALCGRPEGQDPRC